MSGWRDVVQIKVPDRMILPADGVMEGVNARIPPVAIQLVFVQGGLRTG
jgi:urease gamma subunit